MTRVVITSVFFLLGASGKVRIDSSGDREPDYSLKYYVNGSFQNIADYSHSTGGFNLRVRYTYITSSVFKFSSLSAHISYNTLERICFLVQTVFPSPITYKL